MKSHPWLASLLSRRPTLGPHYLKWFEFLLAASAASGRDMPTRIRMIGTVWSYVSGFIAYELGELETNRKFKLTEAKKRKAAQPYVAKILATGDFPHLAEFLKHSGIGEPTDEGFLAGLNAWCWKASHPCEYCILSEVCRAHLREPRELVLPHKTKASRSSSAATASRLFAKATEILPHKKY